MESKSETAKTADKFRGKYRIASTRLQTWDYSGNGYYFITLCTKDKQNYFGEIADGKMKLNEIGKIAYKYWLEIPLHFNNAKIDEFVVMPNHIHGIIILENINFNSHENIENGNDNENEIVETRQCLVSTGQCLVSTTTPIKTLTNSETNMGRKRFQHPGSQSISSIIGSYKSICTKTINKTQTEINFAWQSRFYDHIIRNEKSLENVRNYIVNNPVKWAEDENNISQYGKNGK